ncbi:MAG: tetratricopeptide repeat protein [Candidatus Latescibacteria bacterium]|nr:tetratricopeptide repeat protein [Candidatus Latescibacterota bacterium]
MEIKKSGTPVQWHKNKRVVVPLLWGLVILAYARALGNGFCFDDQGIVVDNPLVSEGRWGAILLSDYWSGEHTGLYRPLTIASFALNHLVFGGQAWAYHLVNLLLHLGAITLLYLLVAAWLTPEGALLAGLCFGLHPALSEAVIGVVGRAELLSCCLGLAGVWIWSSLVKRQQLSLYVLGLALLAAAPLAKENGICFALGVALWSFWHHRSRPWLWVGALAAAGCSLGVKGLVLGQLQPGEIGFIDNPLAYVGAEVRMLNSAGLLVRYFRLLLFPWPLTADYSYDQIPVIEDMGAAPLWLPLALVITLALGIWQGGRRYPQLFLWVLISGGALLLVANLFLAGGTIFAERLLYLPALGLSMGIGWMASRLQGRLYPLAAWGWCLVTIPLIWNRCADWQDDLHLFRRAVEVSPLSARSHYGLGRALQQQGEMAGALAAYQQALEIYPPYAEVHFNQGAALLSMDRPAEALAAYQRAVQVRPGFVKALYAVAVLVEHLEGEEAAVPAYQALLAADPGHVAGARALSGIWLRQGLTARAAELVRRAVVARPFEPQLRRLLEELLPLR